MELILTHATSYQALYTLGSSCVNANLAIQAWAEELPKSATEILWRGHVKDAERWVHFHGRPVLLYCTLSCSGSGSQPTNQMTDTVWKWCGHKNHAGGHWIPTHRMEFQSQGRLRITSSDKDAVEGSDQDSDLGEDGSWAVGSTDEYGAVSSIRVTWGLEVWNCKFSSFFSMQCTSDGGTTAACFAEQHKQHHQPRTYISLQHENTATFPPGGTVTGSLVSTSFHKVRLDPQTSKIYCPDFRFTTSTGSAVVVGGNGTLRSDVTHAMYGFAQNSCGTADATAVVDLRGTPFSVRADWGYFGYSGQGTSYKTQNLQRVDITGGGYQGGCGPNSDNSTLSNGGANDQWVQCADSNPDSFRIQVGLQCDGVIDEATPASKYEATPASMYYSS